MQRFIAEHPIDQLRFEKEWQSDSSIDRSFTVSFTFSSPSVSIIVDSDRDAPSQSHDPIGVSANQPSMGLINTATSGWCDV